MTAQFAGDRLEKARARFAGRMARGGPALAGPLARQVTDIANAAGDRPAVLAAAGEIAAFLAEAGSRVSKDLVLEAMASFHGHPSWDSLSAQLPRPEQAKPRQLPAGLWADQPWERGELPFGLRWDQVHSILDDDRKLTHNSAWLNREGDYLGFGDLSRCDMVRIANGIEPGELFVVLPESASNPGDWISHGGTKTRPSLEWLAEHVLWLVEPGAAHMIPRYEDPSEAKRTVIDGAVLDEISSEQARDILAKTYGGAVLSPMRSR